MVKNQVKQQSQKKQKQKNGKNGKQRTEESSTASTYIPTWIASRPDFAEVVAQRAGAGPIFAHKALLQPHFSRSQGDTAVLMQWLKQLGHGFESLAPAQLRVLSRCLGLVHLAPGERLRRRERVMYVVLSGKLERRVPRLGDDNRRGTAVRRRGGNSSKRGEGSEVLPASTPFAFVSWWDAAKWALSAAPTHLGAKLQGPAALAALARDSAAPKGSPRSGKQSIADVVSQLRRESNTEHGPNEAAITALAALGGASEERRRSAAALVDGAKRILTGHQAAQSGSGMDATGHASSRRSGITRAAQGGGGGAGGGGGTHGGAGAGAGAGASGGGAVLRSVAEVAESAAAPQIGFMNPRRFGVTLRGDDELVAAAPDPRSTTAVPSELLHGVDVVSLSFEDFERAQLIERDRLVQRAAKFLQEHVKAFRGWSVGRLVHLANFLELLELQAGETAFQQGDVADGLCILLSGQCKATKVIMAQQTNRCPTGRHSWTQTRTQNKVVVDVLPCIQPGEVFGEDAVGGAQGRRRARRGAVAVPVAVLDEARGRVRRAWRRRHHHGGGGGSSASDGGTSEAPSFADEMLREADSSTQGHGAGQDQAPGLGGRSKSHRFRTDARYARTTVNADGDVIGRSEVRNLLSTNDEARQWPATAGIKTFLARPATKRGARLSAPEVLAGLSLLAQYAPQDVGDVGRRKRLHTVTALTNVEILVLPARYFALLFHQRVLHDLRKAARQYATDAEISARYLRAKKKDTRLQAIVATNLGPKYTAKVSKPRMTLRSLTRKLQEDASATTTAYPHEPEGPPVLLDAPAEAEAATAAAAAATGDPKKQAAASLAAKVLASARESSPRASDAQRAALAAAQRKRRHRDAAAAAAKASGHDARNSHRRRRPTWKPLDFYTLEDPVHHMSAAHGRVGQAMLHQERVEASKAKQSGSDFSGKRVFVTQDAVVQQGQGQQPMSSARSSGSHRQNGNANKRHRGHRRGRRRRRSHHRPLSPTDMPHDHPAFRQGQASLRTQMSELSLPQLTPRSQAASLLRRNNPDIATSPLHLPRITLEAAYKDAAQAVASASPPPAGSESHTNGALKPSASASSLQADAGSVAAQSVSAAMSALYGSASSVAVAGGEDSVLTGAASFRSMMTSSVASLLHGSASGSVLHGGHTAQAQHPRLVLVRHKAFGSGESARYKLPIPDEVLSGAATTLMAAAAAAASAGSPTSHSGGGGGGGGGGSFHINDSNWDQYQQHQQVQQQTAATPSRHTMHEASDEGGEEEEQGGRVTSTIAQLDVTRQQARLQAHHASSHSLVHAAKLQAGGIVSSPITAGGGGTGSLSKPRVAAAAGLAERGWGDSGGEGGSSGSGAYVYYEQPPPRSPRTQAAVALVTGPLAGEGAPSGRGSPVPPLRMHLLHANASSNNGEGRSSSSNRSNSPSSNSPQQLSRQQPQHTGVVVNSGRGVVTTEDVSLSVRSELQRRHTAPKAEPQPQHHPYYRPTPPDKQQQQLHQGRASGRRARASVGMAGGLAQQRGARRRRGTTPGDPHKRGRANARVAAGTRLLKKAGPMRRPRAVPVYLSKALAAPPPAGRARPGWQAAGKRGSRLGQQQGHPQGHGGVKFTLTRLAASKPS